MKTTPMAHQVEGQRRLDAAPEFFALGAEQGTGKTWMLMNDAERQFNRGLINGLLVIAPKGVHVNWVRREIPAHMSVPNRAGYWLSGSGKRYLKTLEKIFWAEQGELAILTMNVDAVNTKDGHAMAERFLRQYRCMFAIDESQRIKTPTAKRTKKILDLAELAVSRRIASGTLVANSPLDLFSQYQFLRPGLLGTNSFRAFTAEYAELLPPEHPLVQTIRQRSRARGLPQVIAKEGGRPKFKNLKKLHDLIAPHTYRVLKSDCLDLPDKIYTTHYFELSKPQRRVYEGIKADLRYERSDGEIDTFTALTLINKLRQVTSGFIMVDGEATSLREAAPRLSALKEIVADAGGQLIIWATFREEIKQIAEALADEGVVTYYGDTSDEAREDAVDDFQAGKARIFIGNKAASTGLTLTAASTVVFYSNEYSLEVRSQSEDRAHRYGQTKSVVYIDLAARDTIDEQIAAALQSKKGVAAEVLDGAF